jgi:hypothetical protein
METVYKPGKCPLIKGLAPGLTERGKIKIGKKGETRQSQNGPYQLPTKVDHFIITTLERDNTGNFAKDKSLYDALKLPAEPKVIPIRLLFDDIEMNFQSRYACFRGQQLWCSGDGEYAHRQAPDGKSTEQVQCPCHRQDPKFKGEDSKGNGRCKINGTLQCIIDGANVVGGIWKLRTTGYNTVVGITGSLMLLRSITGGVLAGIPLNLTIQPKVATNPTDGKSVTVFVVGVEYRGTITELHKSALSISQEGAMYRERLAHVADEARRLISIDAELQDQAGDIQEEYYPEDQPAPQLALPQGLAPETPADATPVTVTQTQSQPTNQGQPATGDSAQRKPRRGRKSATQNADANEGEPEQVSMPIVGPESANASTDPVPEVTVSTGPAPAPTLPTPPTAISNLWGDDE